MFFLATNIFSLNANFEEFTTNKIDGFVKSHLNLKMSS